MVKRRIGAFIAALMATLALCAAPALADTPSGNAGDDSDYSMASVSSAAANFFDIAVASGNEAGHSLGLSAAGQGGDFVGFIDTTDTNAIKSNYLFAVESKNIQSMDVDAVISQAQSGGVDMRLVADYLRFGRAMSRTGLDQTTTQTFIEQYRRLSSMGLFGAWIVASAVPTIFNWAVYILKLLNPFALFLNPSAADSVDSNGNVTSQVSRGDLAGISGVADGINGGTGNIFTSTDSGKNVIDIFGSIFGNIYWASSNYIFPALIVLALAIFLVSKAIQSMGAHRSASTLGKRALILGLFIFFLLPAMGSIYTGILNGLTSTTGTGTATVTGSPQANKIVMSTLFDFERAVYGPADARDYSSVGAIPNLSASNISITVDESGYPTNSTWLSLRNDVYVSNMAGGSGKWLAYNAVEGGDYAFTNTFNSSTRSFAKNNQTDPSTDDTLSLLQRYQSNTTISAASYESAVKAAAANSGGTDLPAWIRLASNPRNYAKGVETAMTDPTSFEIPAAGSDLIVSGGTVKNINKTNERENQIQELLKQLDRDRLNNDPGYMNNAMQQILEQTYGKSAKEEVNNWGRVIFLGGHSGLGPDRNGTYSLGEGKGLSPLSMYNFLSTDFSRGNANIYSAKRSANGYVAVAHYSVNPVGGTGIYGVVIMLNGIVTLAAYGLIGIVYFLSLVGNNLKRGVSMIASTPFAVLGITRSIVRWILTVAMMIFETIGIIALYDLVIALFDALMAFIMTDLPGIVKNIAPNTGLMATTAMGVLSSIFVIAFIIFALRLRKVLIGGISDSIEALLQRLTQEQAGGDVRDSNVAGGLARGALMAASMAGGAGAARSLAGAALVSTGAAQLASDPAVQSGVQSMMQGANEVAGSAVGGIETNLLRERGGNADYASQAGGYAGGAARGVESHETQTSASSRTQTGTQTVRGATTRQERSQHSSRTGGAGASQTGGQAYGSEQGGVSDLRGALGTSPWDQGGQTTSPLGGSLTNSAAGMGTAANSQSASNRSAYSQSASNRSAYSQSANNRSANRQSASVSGKQSASSRTSSVSSQSAGSRTASMQSSTRNVATGGSVSMSSKGGSATMAANAGKPAGSMETRGGAFAAAAAGAAGQAGAERYAAAMGGSGLAGVAGSADAQGFGAQAMRTMSDIRSSVESIAAGGGQGVAASAGGTADIGARTVTGTQASAPLSQSARKSGGIEQGARPAAKPGAAAAKGASETRAPMTATVKGASGTHATGAAVKGASTAHTPRAAGSSAFEARMRKGAGKKGAAHPLSESVAPRTAAKTGRTTSHGIERPGGNSART